MRRPYHARFLTHPAFHSSTYHGTIRLKFRKHWPNPNYLQHKDACYLHYMSKVDGKYSENGSSHDLIKEDIPLPNDNEHWFKDWQELRRDKLTASTFAGAIGFWRGRRVQLWLEKLGTTTAFVGNAATRWSNIHEHIALERYMLISGNTILLPSFQECNLNNPSEDWLAASADGIIQNFYCGLPYDGILEIKCPYFGGESGKSFPWSKIPIHYVPQVQGVMEVLGKDWMDLYCWTPNGSSLFRLHRSQQYCDLMKSALYDFWWKHVQPAKEICSMYPIEDPIREMSPLVPAPKHERFREIVYESKKLADDSKLLLREIHGKLE